MKLLWPLLLPFLALGSVGCAGNAPLPEGDDDDVEAVDAGEGPGETDDAGPGAPDGSGPPPPADAAPAGAADAAPSEGCEAAAWTPGQTKTISLTHGGLNRSYIVHVGSSVGAAAPVPLLLNFHGLTSNASQQQFYSGTNKTADDNGFVVVYPNGVSSSFNAIGCCGSAAQQNVDDVGFARAVVEDVAANVCIDRKRVYATGMSNGGFMSFRLACSASDVFAAVAPVAGALASSTCQPTRPVPVIAFHGNADSVVSYASGEAAVATFRTKNGCSGQPTRTMHGSAYCDRWSACAGGAAVVLCTFPGLGHAWPMASNGHAASPALWAFLKEYSLP